MEDGGLQYHVKFAVVKLTEYTLNVVKQYYDNVYYLSEKQFRKLVGLFRQA